MNEILIDSLNEFHIGGGKFELPNRFVRYIEFENTVVFLLDKNSATQKHSDRYKIVAIKFSQEGGINRLYIAWDFQIIDKSHRIHNIDGMSLGLFNGNEVLTCYSDSFDIRFSLDVETGEVLSKINKC